MSAKLSALTSDSYIDISQYRDQHFKVRADVFLSNIYKDAKFFISVKRFVLLAHSE